MNKFYSLASIELPFSSKAIFEASSYEGNQISMPERTKILVKLISKGYDLNNLVIDYLDSKVSIGDDSRIFIIAQTLNHCSNELSVDYVPLAKDIYAEVQSFENIVKSNFNELLNAFIDNENSKYSSLAQILGIDFNKDITLELEVRDMADGNDCTYSYCGLLEWWKKVFMPNLRNNEISYFEPSFDTPANQNANILIKKFFPKEDHVELMQNKEFRHNRLRELNIKVINVLWFSQPIAEEPIYLVRCNYRDKVASEIDWLYENNIISICIQDDEKVESEYFDALIKNINPSFNKKLPYIYRFVKLVNLVQSTDVIVIGSYVGKSQKIGLLKKGSSFFVLKRGGYKLYCLKMSSTYCTPRWGEICENLNLSHFPVLKSIIPQQVTISAVNQRKNVIYSIYYGVQIPICLSSMSNSAIEVMCAEWLRSKYADQKFRILYQILQIGGNFADIDIIGVNDNDKVVVAQVSNTDDNNLINKKIKKLNNFESTTKIMFSMQRMMTSLCESVCIGDVWEQLSKDPIYDRMIERLIKG